MDKALKILKEVQRILGTEEVYLVGGSVRDLVLGHEPKDYDFCTPMLPDDVEAAVEAAGRHSYGIGKKFGTIGFKVSVEVLSHPDPIPAGMWTDQEYSHLEFEYVEVTTFRSEVYTSKSRKPEVQFVPTLLEDLSRRDFTFNAMVLKGDGKIFDPFGGKLDIHGHLIKTVGMPKDRIQEDPLRILRAARFAARYGYDLDANFIGKARQLSERILDVSRERWVLELDKLLMSEHHQLGINLLEQMGVLKFMLPELSFMLNQNNVVGTEWERQHAGYDMEVHWANPMFHDEDDLDTRWKILLWHVSMPASRRYTEYGYISVDQQKKIAREINVGICARLKFSNDRTKRILDK